MRVWALMVVVQIAFTLPEHARAQYPPVGLRASGSSFMYARYSTEAALALYAACGFGPISMVVGAVQNHESGYRETMGGALSSISYGKQAVTLAVAYTDATDAPYLQL